MIYFICLAFVIVYAFKKQKYIERGISLLRSKVFLFCICYLFCSLITWYHDKWQTNIVAYFLSAISFFVLVYSINVMKNEFRKKKEYLNNKSKHLLLLNDENSRRLPSSLSSSVKCLDMDIYQQTRKKNLNISFWFIADFVLDEIKLCKNNENRVEGVGKREG